MQPDQDTARWSAHAGDYEAVFEPLTDAFNRAALTLLGPMDGTRLVDVAAGPGGTAMMAARQGARVTAVDAAPAMVARIMARTTACGLGAVRAGLADAAALPFPDGTFDAALSSFGIVLLPDPARGMAELHRVLRPGGRVAVVTWTEPDRYEVAARLRDATIAVRGPAPAMGEMPAQLRFTDPARLRDLVEGAGFGATDIHRVAAALTAASATVLAGSLGFAPGMAAALDALGPDRDAVLRRFADDLRTDQGPGPVTLAAVAHIAVATRP